MDDDDDFDVDLWQYDYWMDIDYGSDGDEIRQRRLDSRATRAKRRRLAETTRATPSKRRKVLPRRVRITGRVRPMDELSPVLKMKDAVVQRYEAQHTRLVDVRTLTSHALLGDWRERFQNTAMWAKKKPTVKLEEVHDAPDDDGSLQDEELGEARALLQAAQRDGEADEEWEDEEEDAGEGAEDDRGAMDLDPAALKMAIQQNLAAAGVNVKGMDEDTLMRFAMKMFAGGGDADDVVGEFAEQLLGGKPTEEAEEDADQTEEEKENGFAGWVRNQAEEKATKKQDTHDLPTPADSQGKPSASPPDKRPAENGSVLRGTKRKADSAVGLTGEPKRAATRRFDAPTAASKARSVSGAAPATRKGRKG